MESFRIPQAVCMVKGTGRRGLQSRQKVMVTWASEWRGASLILWFIPSAHSRLQGQAPARVD